MVIFPLPLTPFEYYYWCDDRPGYPTAYPFELQFSGIMDRQSLTDAWRTALARHPMLRARVDDSEKWPTWNTAGCPEPVLDWATAEKPIVDDDTQPIDLTAGSGLKAWVRVGGSATRFRLRFHHACCDGLGALRFLEDILLAYAQQADRTQTARLPDLDAQLLPTRGEVGLVLGHDTPQYRPTFRDVCFTAIEWTKFLGRRCIPLAPANADNDDVTPVQGDTGFLTVVVDAETIEGLRKTARSADATFNDVLLRDLLQIVRDWNMANDGQSRGWTRVNMPVNLRVDADKALPATNRISHGFISRRALDCIDADQLLKSIRDETLAIRQDHTSLAFLGGLAFASGVRGMLPWFLHHQRCFASIVLSNVGRPFAQIPLPRKDGRIVCGNVTLDEIGCVPPIRPFTRVAIAVHHYANQLVFNLRYDRQCYTPAQAHALLDQYIAKLKETSQACSAVVSDPCSAGVSDVGSARVSDLCSAGVSDPDETADRRSP